MAMGAERHVTRASTELVRVRKYVPTATLGATTQVKFLALTGSWAPVKGTEK
jgi:hypothetical protein